MKKYSIYLIVLMLILSLFVFASCTPAEEPEQSGDAQTTEPIPEETEPETSVPEQTEPETTTPEETEPEETKPSQQEQAEQVIRKVVKIIKGFLDWIFG